MYVDGNLVKASNGRFGSEEVVQLTGGGNDNPSPTQRPVPNPTPAPVPNPTPAPVPNPTQPPVPAPTPNSGPTGSCSGHEFRLELQTDEWGEEVSWFLEDSNGNIVLEGGNYPSGENTIDVTECLAGGDEFTFKIMDSYGDGMCCGKCVKLGKKLTLEYDVVGNRRLICCYYFQCYRSILQALVRWGCRR